MAALVLHLALELREIFVRGDRDLFSHVSFVALSRASDSPMVFVARFHTHGLFKEIIQ
jgi:hypothetical protein